MSMPILIADTTSGTKGIPLQALPDSAWKYLVGTPDDEGMLSPISAYKRVAWIYRGVDMRAKAVQKMPYSLMRGEEDVTKLPEMAKVQHNLSSNLYRTEAALCIYGASYWKLDRNVFGMNITPRWLLPSSIVPDLDEDDGLLGFNRTLNRAGRGIYIKIQDMVYFWVPNLEAELGPGIAPAKVAMMAAGVLHNVNLYQEAYFKRGAVRPTVIAIEGNVQPAEMEKAQSFFQRRLTGIRNAFSVTAVRGKLTAQTIGDSMKDTVNPILTDQARQEVSTALGVPLSLMKSDALAGGTATAEQLNFYDQTVIPECDLIAEVVNAQWLDALGLTLVFHPEKLEIFQSLELQKAGAVSQVVGRPVLTVDEGRELLGKGPLPIEQVDDVVPNAVHIQPLPNKLGSAAPDQLPKLEPAKPDPMAKALDLWEKKAVKRVREQRSAKCAFESGDISSATHAWVLARLDSAKTPADVKAVFSAAKRRNTRVRAAEITIDDATLDAVRRKLEEAKRG